MITGTLLFLAGVWLLELQAQLPSPWWLAALPLLLVPFYLYRSLRPILALAMGFLWALLHAHMVMQNGIADELQGRDLYVEGVVVSLPDQTRRRARFEFQVERMELDGGELPVPGRIRLSWYQGAPRIGAGQRWGLLVRMKRPHGFANPGGFDYAGWLLQRGVRASGYVRESVRNGLLGEAGGLVTIQRWRQTIRDRINAMSGEPQGAALLNGLVVGDRSGIGQEQWQLFARTGTGHLIAISGLHIGIVFGLMFFVMRRLWCMSRVLPLLLPAQQAAALFGLMAAGVYAAMAGFAIPTQRALIMLLVFVAGYLLRCPPNPSRALATSLLLVLLWDPQAVLSAGFWLSFMAVGAILFGCAGRAGRGGWLQQWGRVQWIVALGLAPVLLALGLQVSPLAPLINLIAVPLFSLVIVPLSLLTVLLLYLYVPLGTQMLRLTDWMLVQTMNGLGYLGDIPFATWTVPELPYWVWLPVVCGVLMLLSPRGMPARWLGLVFLMPVLLIRPAVPEYGSVSLTVLDVGQGLALVIRTEHHTLLYDLGPRFSDEFNAGSSAVLPYLRSSGIDHIDLLLVSNGDMDHSGGLSGVMGQVEMGPILSGEPQRLGVAAGPCRAGLSWEWDGVYFRILHPAATGTWKGNNASCVLKVEAAGRGILIPGDIEKEVETRLLSGARDGLRSDLVLMPHHGSKSSSTMGFIQAVAPMYVIVSSGYRNRYGFPDAGVVRRWRSAGAEVLNTAELGAIEVRVDADGSIPVPASYRQQRHRYWW